MKEKEKNALLYCCICLAATAPLTAPHPASFPQMKNLQIRGHNPKLSNKDPRPILNSGVSIKAENRLHYDGMSLPTCGKARGPNLPAYAPVD